MKAKNPDHNPDYLIDMLIDLGFVTRKQVGTFRKEKPGDKSVVGYMLTKKVITPTTLTFAMAAYLGYQMVCLRKRKISDEVIATVPAVIARKYKIVPLELSAGELKIAIADPSDLATIDSLIHLLKFEIAVVIATEADITWALNRFYPENPKRQNWWRRGKK